MVNIVSVRGKLFASQAEAAKHFNVTPPTISLALSRGRADFIGLALSRGRAKEVTYGGVTYPSQAQMGRALGMTRGKVAWLVRKNKSPS